MAAKAHPERKTEESKRIIARYELGGCYTTDDWNLYAKACHVAGQSPRLNPMDPDTDIAILRSQGLDI